MQPKSLDEFHAGVLNEITEIIHRTNTNKGWHCDRDETPTVGDVCKHIALIHSEVSEALEGFRKNLQDDHLPERSAFEVELADAMIRIFDLAGFMGFDIGNALVEKVHYNDLREDHRPENRAKVHGKRF